MENKIIVIPDVHGRNFWRNIDPDQYQEMIFLGDYLDPYPWECISRKDTIQGFQDIIELKKKHPKKITLLLGNHDCEYAYGTSICDCRRDIINYQKIRELFKNNRELFDLAKKEKIGEQTFIFSHAGILKSWAEVGYKETMTEDNIVDLLNNDNQLALQEENPEDTKLGRLLGMVDYNRGGWCDLGSCVWGDVYGMMIKEHYPVGIHVFGHSQQESDPIIRDSIACLDCRRAFEITETGKIKEIEH